LRKYAADLDLDLNQFDRDVRDPTLADRVRADFDGSIRSGVKGTPTFLINGVRIDAGCAFEELVESINAASGG